MICKIIEDDYTFEQIESIEAIFELEKKYNLNISIEDKSYPELYPEIGLQTSYKVYKNDKLIAFSGFLFYFYTIADLTSFDIVKICRFKIKHFPKQYEINLDLLKFGEIGTIWYLIENKWWSYFTSESKKNFLHEETFEEIFLSQDFNKKNYKDLIKLLKYSNMLEHPLLRRCINIFKLIIFLFHLMENVKNCFLNIQIILRLRTIPIQIILKNYM